MPEENFFNDPSSLQAALQKAMAEHLRHTLEHAELVTLFLSGGTSPLPFYESFALETLPWQRIAVALVDERWVPADHQASNERMIRAALLREAAARCHFTGMKNAFSLGDDEEDAKAAVAQCNACYSRLPKPWSAALLGMGPDGHTASLFAGAPELPHALTAQQHCVAIHAPESIVTGAHTARMSMTPWSLLQCKRLFLMFTGTAKRNVYEQAKTVRDPASLPIALFLQQTSVPMSVFWCP